MNHIKVTLHLDSFLGVDDIVKKVKRNFDNNKIDLVAYRVEIVSEFPDDFGNLL